MVSIRRIAVAATLAVGAALVMPVGASAMNLSAGAASAASSFDVNNIVQVQYNPRVRPGVRPGGRPGVRPVGRGPVVVTRSRNRGVGRGVAAGIGAAAAVGIVGAAIAAGSRPQGRYYEEPVRVREQCFIREEELYDRRGNPRGVFPVRVCR